MAKIFNFIKNDKFKWIQTSLFILFFVFGLSTVKDYGISYDEQDYRQHGFTVLNYIGNKVAPDKVKKITNDRNLDFKAIDQFHDGGVNTFKIQHTLYAGIEYLFLKNAIKKDVYLMRHYLNFLTNFLALLLFYKILRSNFSRIYSLTGIIFYFLNPKMLPEFVYNVNDLWFTFFIILFVYSLINYLKKDKKKYLLILILSIALAINVRFIGIYLLPIFILLFYINKDFKIRLNDLKLLFYCSTLLIIILFLLTPQIWYDPLSIFNTFTKSLTVRNFDPQILFMGEIINSSNLPRYYLLIWIAISTPLLLVIFTLFGFFSISKKFISLKFYKLRYHNDTLIMLLIFLIPLIFVIVLKPNIFNGWRHFYFLYPSIVYFAVYGLNKFIENKFITKIKEYFLILIFANFVYLFFWSVKNHPYQNVFLNLASKKYIYYFESDYWGLTNVNAIKEILKIDKSDMIKIADTGVNRIDFSLNMLNLDEIKRLKYVKDDEDENIDYYISNLNDGNPKEYYLNNNFKIIKEIKVDGNPINLTMKK
jgi:hypothetical protein